MGYLVRSIGYRVKKHFFPKTMEASKELSQLDVARTNKELIKLQQKQIQIENKFLDQLGGSNEELTQLKVMFAQYAIKNYEQQEKIYNGMLEVDSKLKVINNSILESTNKVVNSIEVMQNELIEILKNPQMTNADALRRIGKQRFGALVISENNNKEDLKEATEFYEKSTEDFVGKTNPLTWLELGHIYTYDNQFSKAQEAYKKADRLSNQGEKIIYEIRNEALFNLILIELNNGKFQDAYYFIEKILHSNQSFDTKVLLLKGIVEFNLGHKAKGLGNIIYGLNKRPELVRELYIYSAEGVLLDKNSQEYIVNQICSSKRKKIKEDSILIQETLSNSIKIIKKYASKEFNKEVAKAYSLINKINGISENDYLSLFDLEKSLSEIKAYILKNLNGMFQDAINDKDREIDNCKNEVESFFGYGIRTAEEYANSQAIFRFDEFKDNFPLYGLIGFIILMFLLNNTWYWRILTGIIIIAAIYKVSEFIFFGTFDYETMEKEANTNFNALKASLDNLKNEKKELEKMKKMVGTKIQRLVKIE